MVAFVFLFFGIVSISVAVYTAAVASVSNAVASDVAARGFRTLTSAHNAYKRANPNWILEEASLATLVPTYGFTPAPVPGMAWSYAVEQGEAAFGVICLTGSVSSYTALDELRLATAAFYGEVSQGTDCSGGAGGAFKPAVYPAQVTALIVLD